MAQGKNILGQAGGTAAAKNATPLAQAQQIDFALHTLGWKAFQDLAVAVAAEVLERPVQTFLPSQDGGRDGAFWGTWPGAPDVPEAKSTIQCKFTGKPSKTLKLSDISGELSKIDSLKCRGLAHDYVLLTNAGVSGQAEGEMVSAIEAAGATRARVLGRDWLTEEIRSRPRLRMMVPRLYGLGDLSQIIDERAYTQARFILSSMGDDLAAFVTTAAHRQSVEALQKHRFVLLLGDPASGKSTIGASLAVGALDDGAIGTVRISDGPGFEQHWNPNEPSQFFWIDDAFGETQYQRSRVDSWNSRLKMMHAAVKSGARVLMTSRTYIWNSAKFDLKLGEFPLLSNSQVIIDVQGLTDLERAQILYNHIRLGEQPISLKRKLKPFLPSVATNTNFLPETARRLASPYFTGKLSVSRDGLSDFFERPIEFLRDVLIGLAEPERAAVALIFLHGPTGVPSPIANSTELTTVYRLTGVPLADVARAMEALRGSLTLLVEAPDGPRWVFKHPTVADAFAEIVSGSPEMIELYVRGAKLEKLLSEVVCGTTQLPGASVHIPRSLYDTLIDRMQERELSDRDLLRFAAHRGDDSFLERYFGRLEDPLAIAERINSDMYFSAELDFVAKAHARGLADQGLRAATVERVTELCLNWADATPFKDEMVQGLFEAKELHDLSIRFRHEIVNEYGLEPQEWDERLLTGDRARHLQDLKEAIQGFAAFGQNDPELLDECAAAEVAIDDYAATLDDDDEPDTPSAPASASKLSPTEQLSVIFEDVDD